MEPSLGWTLLSRDALRRAETQMRDEVQGVRDEIGFLALHQAYADRFFPGTSVLHTRLRYALFVPWLYQGLIERGVRERVSDALEHSELQLTGRLKKAGESGIIGARNYPKPTTQPPCMIYWSALGAWRVLRPLKDGSYPARSVIHRTISRRTNSGRLHDDDKQLLEEDENIFAGIPGPPNAWSNSQSPLDFRLSSKERRFLSGVMLAVSRPNSNEPSLLARLVEKQVQMNDRIQMWSPRVLNIADTEDREAIIRAKRTAALSAIGRAVYAALVEEMREKKDRVATESIHRANLPIVVEEFGADAIQLEIEGVVADSNGLKGKIVEVLNVTQNWLRAGARDVDSLYSLYRDAEERRKGRRARLSQTLLGREKRSEWLPDEHPKATPLHYRWQNARRFLMDLGGEDE